MSIVEKLREEGRTGLDGSPGLKICADAAQIIDELTAALKDTLSMLRAAHMQCGAHHDGNKRVIKARAALSKAEKGEE